jgi:hypothetical protein
MKEMWQREGVKGEFCVAGVSCSERSDNADEESVVRWEQM